MSKKCGIELKLTYGMWNCTVPAKLSNAFILPKLLKDSIKQTMLEGCVNECSREPMAFARAPFMDVDTIKQAPYVKVELNEKRVKSHLVDDGIEIAYVGPIEVTLYWKAI